MKIAVAMSGGVDSSVTAALLKKEGHEVIGLTMLVTASEEAANAAAEATRALGIPHYIFDFSATFSEQIISDFCRQYSLGMTPNPCVCCNRLIKFGVLLEKAKELGAETMATGHYARIAKRAADGGRFLLKKGIDRKRDQSYFLYKLTQSQLVAVIFPLGILTKDKVREIASEMKLPTADRQESREICFIPDNDYPRFVREQLTSEIKPGQVVDKQGNVMGKHNGVIDYTIGQRKGLGISSKEPLYVVDIDCQNNAVIVGGKRDVYASEFIAGDLNWLAFEKLASPITLKARIRYLHTEAEALIAPIDDDKVGVKFAEPQMAITPGQAAVFYNGDIVVGGGTIERVLH
ncbi:MAG: tRNA 2-thiouridine(34) synthase MnmA [Dehalococcoidales bacterium]|nr:tRNA 2-thiouridine(34) synthase MnmA [Dehalococcoidales bacterium]